ncbi:MAG TPA: LysR family transcriptional regulator [Bryobacteraceae bacterium]|nr:LysR family transcriptional regulator [Bryobacteraceae bacterium]
MLFDNLKLFRDIAQSKSVSRGASLNGISQSAASQYLQEMERRMEVALLDRTTRPLALTPAGKLFYDLCRDALRREEQFQVQLENLKGFAEGTVRVASIYSIGLSEMSRLQEEFTARFPHAQLHVDYLRPDKVYEAVLADQADLGLVSYPEAAKDLAVIPWREEEMTVAAPPWHPLAAKPVLLPADLDGQDFVGFDEELMIRRELDHFFREHSIEIRMAMQFDNIQMIKEAVALGSGISILPARTMQAEIAQGRLVSIPLHAPELVRPVGIVHRKRKRFSHAVQSFLELLLEQPAPVGQR